MSYGKSGVKHTKLVKSEHGMVYTGKTPPEADPEEHGMQEIPIKVVPDQVLDRLWPKSRINYGKKQTVEHNVRVKSFGVVDQKDKVHLVHQARVQWESPQSAPPLSGPAEKGVF